MSDAYGPALPPGFGGTSTQSEDPRPDSSNTSESTSRTIGPALPPGFKSRDSGTSDSSDDSADEASKLDSSGAGGIGPVMPPGFVPQNTLSDQSSESESEPEDPNTIGPMLSEAGGELTAAEDFERRAALMRNKLLNQGREKPKEREEWMTALPDKKLGLSLGLQARTFRANDRTDGGYDDSWTETPSDQLKKEQDLLEGKVPAKKRKREVQRSSQRDQLMEQQAEMFNKSKNRAESLLELHQKKLAGPSKKKKKEKDKKGKKDKKKKKEKTKEKEPEKKPERVPFDRETDLKVNKFDDAMRKQYIKKAQGLTGRFGHGQTKFV